MKVYGHWKVYFEGGACIEDEKWHYVDIWHGYVELKEGREIEKTVTKTFLWKSWEEKVTERRDRTWLLIERSKVVRIEWVPAK